ncbi:MAG TPA: hypothetical protein VKZ67_06405 [Natronosporangium sp.]|nr:hypothetical protein [Natronosporangium sp.]
MSYSSATQGGAARTWSVGGLVFAATMLVLIGVWQVLMGLAAILDDGFLLATEAYPYALNTTAWGWLHLVIGVLVLVVGFGLFSNALWARVAGIFLAMTAAVANFFFLPYYPLWALVVIALSVFVIWALANAPLVSEPAG